MPIALTSEEIARMTATGDYVRCPDCNTLLNEGPSAGVFVNLKCNKCDVVFNWGNGLGCEVVHGKRKIADLVK